MLKHRYMRLCWSRSFIWILKKLNKEVFWQPDWAGSNWFDSWLNNLRDNGITRQRYWGTPLPIWRCETCGKYDVIGSVEELEKKASLYKVAQVLNLTAPAVYKWRKKNVIPDLRLYQLREKKPEWFSDLTPA